MTTYDRWDMINRELPSSLSSHHTIERTTLSQHHLLLLTPHTSVDDAMLQGGVRRMQQRVMPAIVRRAATATRACTEEELRDQVSRRLNAAWWGGLGRMEH